MSCFPCFQSQRSSKSNSIKESTPRGVVKQENEDENIESQAFTFRELASATKNFRQECLLGEGGFGRVYKGTLASTGQVVAIKQLDKNSVQANKFLAEVAVLSRLQHPNLITLVGYCADGDQRLLVYEFINGESLQDRLLERKEDKEPLDWFSRMRIAFATSKGLEYAHQTSTPPIIYRDLKPSNILLDEELTPKLSDLGLTRLSPSGDKLFQSSRVMGTYGYCAPEYSKNGELTTKSDVYSFGVILLELITGRKAIDPTKPVDEQNLVSWAQPIFRDPKRFPDMADPLLRKQFPEKELNQAVAIAAMCLQEESGARPFMSDVVTALSFLSMSAEDAPPPLHPLTPCAEEKDEKENKNKDSSDSDSSDRDSSDDGEASAYEDEDGVEEEEEEEEEDCDDHSEYLDSESVNNDEECSVHSGQERRGDEPGRTVSKVKSRAKSSKSRASSRKSSKRSRSRTKSSRKGKNGDGRNSSSGEE